MGGVDEDDGVRMGRVGWGYVGLGEAWWGGVGATRTVFAWPLRSQLDRASVIKRIRPTAVPVRRYLLHARREQTNFVELDLCE